MNSTKNPLELTKEEALDYMKANCIKEKTWYYNIRGFRQYLTEEPTRATPTGNLPDFPRTITLTT